MSILLRSILPLLLGLLVLAGVASADTWRVVRNVRLLTSPSATGQKIKTLHPPDRVTATGGKNGNYIRVEDEDGDAGWVYSPYLEEEPAPTKEVQPSQPTPPGTPAESASIASAISPAWEKPSPQTGPFHLNGKVCGPLGNPGDTETNRRKNRTDVPGTYHAVTFPALDQLPFPNASTSRARWDQAQLAAIAPYEGVAVTVTGYLFKIRPQTGNSEACNCGWTRADETDWHMALTGSHGDLEKDAMVVETTPRIRINHPKWTPANLAPWVGGPDPIRVSGWVLMDPVHKGHLNHYRNTLWEVHPITKIEVMKSGQWVDLDDLP